MNKKIINLTLLGIIFGQTYIFSTEYKKLGIQKFYTQFPWAKVSKKINKPTVKQDIQKKERQGAYFASASVLKEEDYNIMHPEKLEDYPDGINFSEKNSQPAYLFYNKTNKNMIIEIHYFIHGLIPQSIEYERFNLLPGEIQGIFTDRAIHQIICSTKENREENTEKFFFRPKQIKSTHTSSLFIGGYRLAQYHKKLKEETFGYSFIIQKNTQDFHDKESYEIIKSKDIIAEQEQEQEFIDNYEYQDN